MDAKDILYQHEDTKARKYVDVPAWIEPDINCATIAAVVAGGCESGAYMPAVTYHSALRTMSEHGDDVLDYLDGQGFGDRMPEPGMSWGWMAVHFLSLAVNLWCMAVADELAECLEAVPPDSTSDRI